MCCSFFVLNVVALAEVSWSCTEYFVLLHRLNVARVHDLIGRTPAFTSLAARRSEP